MTSLRQTPVGLRKYERSGQTAAFSGFADVRGVSAELRVERADGTDPRLDVSIEQSADGGGSWTRVAAFPTKTRAGASAVDVRMPLADMLRVRWEISGSSVPARLNGGGSPIGYLATAEGEAGNLHTVEHRLGNGAGGVSVEVDGGRIVVLLPTGADGEPTATAEKVVKRLKSATLPVSAESLDARATVGQMPPTPLTGGVDLGFTFSVTWSTDPPADEQAPPPPPAGSIRRARALLAARPLRAFLSAFLAALPLLPAAAGVVATILFFVLAKGQAGGAQSSATPASPVADGEAAYLWGTVIAVAIGWPVLAFLVRRWTRAHTANPREYDELRQELDRWRAAADAYAAAGLPEVGSSARAAYDEARRHQREVERYLGLEGPAPLPPIGLPWVLATGYVTAWKRLHRMEETLLPLLSPNRVAMQARYDRSRIDHSNIPERASLLKSLRVAVAGLSKDAPAYVFESEDPGDRVPKSVRPQPDGRPTDEALGLIEYVRKTVNQFRDDRREGLVRARNNLYATTFFAGMVAYGVLGLALLEGVTEGQLRAAVAFYLVGALIGLFRQLRAASAVDTVLEEDYGLATARLLHVPLFSGIAAVAGVVVTEVALPVIAGNGGGGGTDSPRLSEILTLDPVHLITAAVFGLTPVLLINRLQEPVEKYKADLKSSEAAEQSGRTPPSPV